MKLLSHAMRILYVSYPLVAVNEMTCGGAEQVLSRLEREMHCRGHATQLAASSGSTAAGQLVTTGDPVREIGRDRERLEEHTARVIEHVRAAKEKPQLIHDHSGSFWPHAGRLDVPVLATLHLPRSYYPDDAFARVPDNVWFSCVSRAQWETFNDVPRLLGHVRNGIDLQRFPFTSEKQNYLLWLGRICLEKGPHIALDMAERCGMPIVIAGEVYPFEYHERFFEAEVKPRLAAMGPRAQLVHRPTLAEKVHLLRHAKTLLVPSLADETSSLASMEAMACGTPVVAFWRGGLPETIRNGETGYVVITLDEMAEKLQRVGDIDANACRRHAEANFCSRRMANAYEQLYRQILREAARERAADTAPDFPMEPLAA